MLEIVLLKFWGPPKLGVQGLSLYSLMVNPRLDGTDQTQFCSAILMRGEHRTVARNISIGGLCVSAGVLDILKIDKNYTDL